MIRIKAFRQKRGLPQKALAQAAQIHYVSLLQLEKGRYDPRLSTLKRLAEALGTTVANLIGESGEGTNCIQVKSGGGQMGQSDVQQKKLNAVIQEAKGALEDWRKEYVLKKIRPLIWGYDYQEIDLIIRLLNLKLYNQTE